jgi:hypothetical protein
VARELAQEKEADQHDEADGDCQRISCTSCTASRIESDRSSITLEFCALAAAPHAAPAGSP